MSDRRPAAQGGARRLEMLRQKRNILRTRSEEASIRGGATSNGAHPALHGRQGSDASALAGMQRRRAPTYALSSSSSSSDSEDVGADGGVAAAPTEQEVTAKLFAKLGIKQNGRGGGGFESDSSWASSPEQRGRLIKAAAGQGPQGQGAGAGGEGAEQGQAEVVGARVTIAALQQELAAARAQADGSTQQLRAAQEYARRLEGHLHAAEQELTALRGGASGAAAAGQPASKQHAVHNGGHAADGGVPTGLAGTQPEAIEAELAAANEQLLQEVEVLGCQLAAAAAWQHDVHSMQAALAGMQAAVAESEAARQDADTELQQRLQQREGELLQATARLAGAEAQLQALQGAGAGGGGSGGWGNWCAGSVQLRPAADVLAGLTVTHAQICAALEEATVLLA